VGIKACDEADVCKILPFPAFIFMPINLSNSFSYFENNF